MRALIAKHQPTQSRKFPWRHDQRLGLAENLGWDYQFQP